jgi:MFS family permease
MIQLTVFVTGAVVMVLEVVGSRLLAPQVGTSIHVWTSLIGVILASMSAGYWYGGRLSDRSCTAGGLAKILAIGGCSILICFILSNLVRVLIFFVSTDLRIQAVVGASVLFAMPAFLLGIISPYAIRLRLENLESSGATVGSMYAISTAGSILGTFLGGFVLISLFGNGTIFFGMAGILFLLAFMNAMWVRAYPVAVFSILGLGLVVYLTMNWKVSERALLVFETPYGSYRVVENKDNSGRLIRALQTYWHQAQSTVDAQEPEHVTYPPAIFIRDAYRDLGISGKTLLIGGAPFVVPRVVNSADSRNTFDIVEIDLDILPVAKEYFFFKESSAFQFFFEDGRTFLNRAHSLNLATYDVAILDVYGASFNPPFQLVTKEAFSAIRSLMAKNGWLISNVYSACTGEKASALRAILKTVKTVFPNVAIFLDDPDHPENPQNIYMIASDREIPARVGGKLRGETDGPGSEVILTDDLAPIDDYMKEMQIGY